MPRPHPSDPNAEVHDIEEEDGLWHAIHHLGVGDGEASPVTFEHSASGKVLHGHVGGLGSASTEEVIAALREAKRLDASEEDA